MEEPCQSGAPPNRKCEDTLASVREMFIQCHVARLYTQDAESTIRREGIPLRRNRSINSIARRDLIDMVEWAIAEGVALRDKVAIFGVSYGGYAAFVGATFTPDVFCCSVPVVGITNLQTLLETMPPYWAGIAEFMFRSFGDPRTPEGRALLAERSPIHKVDRIKKPMLIFHGANDVRCKMAESDTIVAAMQTKGIPVTYVVYPDEGHGFQKPPNRLSYIAIAEAFFARHLGGACEPVGIDFDGSSHEVRAGADLLADSVRTG